MSRRVLLLRPEPGASASAARARALGLEPTVAPLFLVGPLPWQPPDPAAFDALLLTSANAARHGGPALRQFAALPCYAVGEATADAAAAAGVRTLRAGCGDGAAAVAELERDGVRRVLHLCGRDHLALDASVTIERRIVYASDAAPALPAEARAALAGGAVALIHSPRAGSVFSRLCDGADIARGAVAIAAISQAAADAAGGGWRSVDIAARPRDDALLELAAKLCQNRVPEE